MTLFPKKSGVSPEEVFQHGQITKHFIHFQSYFLNEQILCHCPSNFFHLHTFPCYCQHERNVTWPHSLLLNNIAQPTMFTPYNCRIVLSLW